VKGLEVRKGEKGKDENYWKKLLKEVLIPASSPLFRISTSLEHCKYVAKLTPNLT
jgi:hypothetical protein